MEIITKSIQELRPAPELKADTELVIQRIGSSRIEKTNVEDLSEALASTKTFAGLKLTADTSGLQMQQHLSANDPHGDKAYSQSLMNTHLQGDPHGSNAYTDNKFKDHINANDPHGSNAFSENRYQQHIKDNDPHGDRAYASTLVDSHSTANDPHGDRLYTDTSISSHSKAEDPHGDRAYTSKMLAEHVGADDPHKVLPLVQQLIETHNKNSLSHNLENRLASFTTSVEKQVDSKILQMVGDSITPLVNGEIPKTLYKNFVKAEGLGVRPLIGERGVLYLDETSKKVSYWDGSRYLDIESSTNLGQGLTTDEIAEGVRDDRKFFSKALEKTLNSKITSVTSYNSTNSLIGDNSSEHVKVKTLKASGDTTIEDRGNELIIGNSTHLFKGEYSDTIRLTTDSTVLDDIGTNSVIHLKGEVVAKSYEVAETNVLIKDYSSWEINSLFINKGTAVSVEQPRNVAISTNGLVTSGFATPASFVKAYDLQGQLIGEATTQVDGGFTITNNRAIIDGSLMLLYVMTEDLLVSEPLYLYTKNRQAPEFISAVSFNKEGTKIRGKTVRGASIIVTDANAVELGRALTTESGNFDISLNKTLLDKDIINVTANVEEKLFSLDSYSVGLKGITLPYNIHIDHSGTVMSGKAEPLSKILIGGVGSTRLASSDMSGDWKYTSFSQPFTKDELDSLLITVMREDRQGTVEVTFVTEIISYGNLPIPNKKTESFEQAFTVNSVKRLLGSSSLSVSIGYDTITKQIYIEGRNTLGIPIKWEGSIKIMRDDIEVQ